MNNYDKSLREKAVAEGWIDGNYKSAESVKLICEEAGLNFEAVKEHRRMEQFRNES